MSDAKAPNILIVAGEASADTLGASLLRELRKVSPNVTAYGVGSKQLKAEGLDTVADASQLSIVGVADWFGRAGGVFSAYRDVRDAVHARRTDVAVLIDLPDFNLRLAGELKALGVPVLYYASPQVWAWRKYRIAKIRRLVSRMLVLYPFEEKFYQERNVPVRFVGHPLRDLVPPRTEYRDGVAIRQAPRIAVLPGSRRSELEHHRAPLTEALRLLRLKYPNLELRIPVPSTLDKAQVAEMFRELGGEVVDDDARSVMAWADFAIVKSGTATLEAALIGTPFLLFYTLHPVTVWIGQKIFRYAGFYGLPNLLLGKETAPEFLYQRCTGDRIAAAAERFLEDDRYREETTAALVRCRSLLGEPGASRRTAEAVLEELDRRTVISPPSDAQSVLA